MLHYTTTATGQKIRQQLVHQDGRVSTTRDGSFVYVNNELVNTPHGRIFYAKHHL